VATTLVRKLLLQINADDADAQTKMDLVSARAEELKKQFPELKVKLDTAEATAKMAVLREELKKPLKVKVEPDVSMFRSLFSSMRGLTGKGGWGQLLGLGGGAGGAAAEGGSAGASGILDFLMSPAGLTTAAAASFPAAALAVTGLGIGVGGLGAFGAYKMGANAQAQMTALTAQQAAIQKQLDARNSKGQLVIPEGSQKATLLENQSNLNDDKMAALRQSRGGVMGVYNDVQGIGKAASSVFESAITGGGKTSFASSLAKDLAQVAGFVKTLGPDLQKMFQASEPYIAAAVKGLEAFAHTVIPAITSALRAFAPHIAGIIRMFQYTADAVGGVIRAMGWMAKGFADLVNWVSEGIHKAVPAIEGWAKDFARYIWTDPRKWIDNAVSDVEKFPGRVVSALGSLAGKLFDIGVNAIKGLINGIEHMASGVLGAVGHIASLIPSGISKILHIFSPSQVMHGIGENIGQGLINGMTSRAPGVSGASRQLAAAAAGGFGGQYGAGGAAGGRIQLEFVGADSAMATALKQIIRVRGGDPLVIGR